MFSFMHCFEKLRSGVCNMYFCLDIRFSICLASCIVLKSSDLGCVCDVFFCLDIRSSIYLASCTVLKSSDLVCV